MVLSGDANKIVRACEKGNGLEAWRRLCWEYEPNRMARQGVVLAGLLRRTFGIDPDAGLQLEVELFERDVREWEAETGLSLIHI
eukprot:2703017-Lingulodinium_polyedra.AAC.1